MADLTVIVDDIAKASVRGHTAWESVEPMTQYMLKESALAFLKVSLPILEQHGWTPPAEPEDPNG